MAPNPPFGALFTYFLNDDYLSAKEVRIKADRAANDAGEDAPFWGFDSLLDEETSDNPAIIFTVRDAGGEIVRRIEGPVTKGINRVAWDLRYPETSAWKREETYSWQSYSGPLVAPGDYTVTMSKRINAEETAWCPTTTCRIPRHQESGSARCLPASKSPIRRPHARIPIRME